MIEWNGTANIVSAKAMTEAKRKKVRSMVAGVAVVAPSEDNASQRGVTQ